MNNRLISVFVFAFVVAGGASLIVYRLIASKLSAQPKAVPTTQVVVAARNLELGTLIKETDLTTAGWAAAPPPKAILKKEDLLGRGVVQAIYEGEPILETRLAPKGAGGGLAATIPTGMRAVAVRVNEVIGVAGFVLPGMRVDVLISGAAPGPTQAAGIQARTLLQNIEVLSAGQNIQRDAEGKPNPVQVVNLLVSPEQAETLSLASSETKIQLVLRNPLDKEIAKTPGTAVANLFGQRVERPAAQRSAPRITHVMPAVAKAPPPVVVEVIQGGRRQDTTFKGQPEE
jgi:pilus assembly protein CpaB